MTVCFVAPMVGGNKRGLPSQGQILFERFRLEEPEFIGTSTKQSRYLRLVDMARVLIANRRRIAIQCLSVYSGPSFILADCLSALGKALGQKLILHLHGGGLPELFGRRSTWAQRVLRRADAIVAPSSFLRRATEKLGFRCQVIPNVIFLEDYPFRERSEIAPRFFWMRSFHPIWNPEMAVQVLADLRATGVAATLVMGGNDKGSLDDVRRMVRDFALTDSVRLAGFLDREGKAREGNAADIFLNTNRVDNMPVALLEAGAMGLPIVSTNVGGIPDLLSDGVTGLLVNSEDVKGMSAAVGRLLREPKLALALSRNGRQLASQSAWPAVRLEWLSLFRQLAGGSN